MREKRTSRLLISLVFLAAAAGIAFAQDNWLGGNNYHFWSDPNWSAGLPVAASDVLIYSGGNDFLYLDISPTVNSLVLGGASNGTTSQIDDGNFGQGAQTLTITNGLTVGTTGLLFLYGGSTASAGSLSNSGGRIDMDLGSTLIVNGNANNSGDVGLDASGYGGGNTLTISGTLTNNGYLGLYGSGDKASLGSLINSVVVNVNNGGTLTVNADSSNTGHIYLTSGSTLSIVGSLLNSGSIQNPYNDGTHGGNMLNISGTLTNSSQIYLSGYGDQANVGALVNSGFMGISHGATNNITGNVLNNGGIWTGWCQGYICSGGDTLNIGGTLTNNNLLAVVGFGDAATLGGLANSANVDVYNGSKLQINGSVTNSGPMLTGGGGGNTLSITGTLTNQVGGQLVLNGPDDMANVGSLNNSGVVDVENGSTLQISSALNNTGILATNYYRTGGGNTVSMIGTLTNQAGGQFLLNGPADMATLGSLNNSGYVLVGNGSSLQINGDLNNFAAGLVYVNNSTLLVNGNLNNSGTLVIDPSTLTVRGALTNNVGSTFTLSAGDTLNVGTLNNLGSFVLPSGTQLKTPIFSSTGSTTVSALATLLVGSGTPGNTGYYQLANGTLGEFIDMSGFGVIVVSDPVHLDGTLDIQLASGFNPVVGSTYEFIEFMPSGLSGVFASLQNALFNNNTERWTVVYSNSGGYVELVAMANNSVPEPSSILLLGTGLLSLSYGIRRRFRS